MRPQVKKIYKDDIKSVFLLAFLYIFLVGAIRNRWYRDHPKLPVVRPRHGYFSQPGTKMTDATYAN